MSLCRNALCAVIFSIGLLRAECLDESGDASKNLNLYLQQDASRCLESLRDWALASPGRRSAIRQARRNAIRQTTKENRSDYFLKLLRLKAAIEKKIADEGLSMNTRDDTYKRMRNNALIWRNASIFSGIVVGGGGYYVARKYLKRVKAFNKWIWRFKFNPAIFVAATAVAIVTGETTMGVVDYLYPLYRENSLEKNLQRLEGGYDPTEKGAILEDIAEDAMGLVAVEEGQIFVFVGELLKFSQLFDVKWFFEQLAESHPELLEEGAGNSRVSLLLEKLESLGATGEEEELEPLQKYLVLRETVRNVVRWYTDTDMDNKEGFVSR